MFKDKYDNMTRMQLEEVIRFHKDFSMYTRKELVKELRELLPEINLAQFSKKELENILRCNYSFSDYTTNELRDEIRSYERFGHFPEKKSKEKLRKRRIRMIQKSSR